MKRTFGQIGFLALAALAFSGCDTTGHDHGDHGHAGQDATVQTGQAGERVYFEDFGDGLSVEIRADKDMAQVGLMAEYAGRERAEALQAELDKVPTLSGKYAVLSGKPAQSAPEALQVLDRLRASEAAAGTDEVSGEAVVPLAKAADHANSASEAGWNWTSDATWFKSLQTQPAGFCRNFQSNQRSLASSTISTEHRVNAMAASHTYGSDYTATYLTSSGIVLYHSFYIQPRHYSSLTYYWANPTRMYLYNNGRGGSIYTRVHLDHVYKKVDGICKY